MEHWLPVEGFDAYEVSNLGRVRSLDRVVSHWRGGMRKIRGTVIKPRLNRYGYLQFAFSVERKKTYTCVHRVVAKAFVPNPLSLSDVNHKDLDKTNCCADNLEWMTSPQNTKHAVAAGLWNPVQNPNRARVMCANDVLEARRLRATGMTYREVGAAMGKSYRNLVPCITGKTWSQLPGAIPSGETRQFRLATVLRPGELHQGSTAAAST